MLSSLQQTPLVNFGGSPNWSAATNPEFDRPTVVHWINRGYIKLVRDVSDIDVAMYSATFTTSSNASMYPITPGSSSPTQGIFAIPFILASIGPGVGPNNSDTAVVASYTLLQSCYISGLTMLFEADAGTPVSVNVAVGNAAMTGTAPTNGAAVASGQSLFAADKAVLPNVTNILAADSPSAVWPAGTVLTLRIKTGSGGVLGPSVALIANAYGGNTGTNISPTPNPPVAEVRRLFYTPAGLGYTLEFEPKVRMLPWKEFQRYTAAGYLNPFSYGVQPEVCSITPDRTQIAFYPGTANAGDLVEVQYSTVPTAGTLVPLLINDSDVPYLIPDDFHELIQIYALYKLWPKARAMESALAAKDDYYKQLDYMRAMWKRRSGGDQQRFTDNMLDRATSGPYGWW